MPHYYRTRLLLIYLQHHCKAFIAAALNMTASASCGTYPQRRRDYYNYTTTVVPATPNRTTASLIRRIHLQLRLSVENEPSK
jgi:hypothetical protein